MRRKIDLKILMDLRILSSTDYESVISGTSFVCMCVCMYLCIYICNVCIILWLYGAGHVMCTSVVRELPDGYHLFRISGC
jgi:hypothetical protein